MAPTVIMTQYIALPDCLTSVSIPNSVTYIGNYAFRNCTNLASISIPDSVTYIGSDAFENTAWYNNQPDGIICVGKLLYKYKGTMPENTNLTIPDSVAHIGVYAFSNCTGLTNITIPNSVTSIDNGAFRSCINLKIIDIPESVTKIGEGAFSDCKNLLKITIPDSIVSVGRKAFENTTWYDNQLDGVIYVGKTLYNRLPRKLKFLIKIDDGTNEI